VLARGKARCADLAPEQQPKFVLLERVWSLDTIQRKTI
jgi:hypothetical protein